MRFFLNGVFFTCKIRVINNDLVLSRLNKKPVLFSLWHQNSLLFAKYVKSYNIPTWTVSSTHSDSEVLARVLLSWKIKLIRGSSTRGWINIIKKMVFLYKNSNATITITPDGPRGPRKKAKNGAYRVASKYNVSVVAVGASASRFWSLPSWDRTVIPKPFSTIYIRFSIIPIKNINGSIATTEMNNNQTSLINDVKNI